jgi:predicted metal-dependent HD superfamily phosphohydrolase
MDASSFNHKSEAHSSQTVNYHNKSNIVRVHKQIENLRQLKDITELISELLIFSEQLLDTQKLNA